MAVERMLEWNWLKNKQDDQYVVTELGKAADSEETAERFISTLLKIAAKNSWSLKVSERDSHLTAAYTILHGTRTASSLQKTYQGRSYELIYLRALEMMVERGYALSIVGHNTYSEIIKVTATGQEKQRQEYGL